jgi:hypothetical protein
LAFSRASFSSSDDAGDGNGIGSDTEFFPARRAAAGEAEAGKAIAQAVEKRPEHLKPTSEAESQQPASAGPPHLGLAGLNAAALKRRQTRRHEVGERLWHSSQAILSPWSPATEALATRRETAVLEETPPMVHSSLSVLP